jgi:phosphoglycolate phosphatase
MPRLTAILFDKDGTLFDFQTSWSHWTLDLVNELGEGDARRTRDLADRIGFDIDRCAFRPDSLSIAGTLTDQAAALTTGVPQMSKAALIQLLATRAAEAPMAPVLPLRPLMDRLRAAGYLLGVATNDAEAAARRHLAREDIEASFAFIAGFDSGHGAKPGPGMCHAFADTLGLVPDTVVMIGDSLHDLHAGRAAGMRTLGVLTGTATRAELAPHADDVIADITGLEAWLDRFTAS